MLGNASACLPDHDHGAVPCETKGVRKAAPKKKAGSHKKRGKTIALMCAEKEPERCHRFALISPVLQLMGISVVHIRPEMKLQANEDLERAMSLSDIDS